MSNASWGTHGLEALPIVTAPKDGRAKLRVTTNDLYDSEVTGTSAITDLSFFRAPEGGVFQNATSTKKTLADTNLKQQGQLGSPLIFDLLGFFLRVTPASGTTEVTDADWMRFYVGSYFEFQFNNRPFLQVPVYSMPHGVGPEGVATATNLIHIHNGVGVRSNIYRFTVGKYRVRIRSTENFNARVVWGASTTFVASVKATLGLTGYLYNGI